MLSFLIDAQDWPANAASFKHTNIMIHVLCGLVLCWLVSELFQILGITAQRSALLGLLAAALWLLHPLNGSTTLYVIQRMAQLMTLFGLGSMLCYLKGRRLILCNPRKGLLLLCLCLFPFALLSVLSKENGVLLLLLIVVFEFSVFRSEPKSRELMLWFRIAVLTPLALFGMYLMLGFADSVAAYEYKYFSFLERLLSESRILVNYLAKIFMPIDAGVGLYHDGFQVSKSFLNPVSTLFSILFLLGLASLAWLWRKSQVMVFLGIAWFFVMHLLESTYLPLELYFEHRNYMAMMGPIIACVWYLNVLLEKPVPLFRKRAGILLFTAMLAFMTWQTGLNSNLWGRGGYLLAYWAEKQADSSWAQITYADFLSANGYAEDSLQRLKRAHELNPREITTLLHMWNNTCESGLVAPYELEEIKDMDGLEYYHNDINHHLKQLVQNLILNRCKFPSSEVMVGLFDRVASLPLVDHRRAGFHVIYSDLFVHYRQLDSALIQLRYAFDLTPQPKIPIRQAMLSASAGNNSDALLFLERARVADREQSFLLPSFEDEIAAMEVDINALLDER